jgi:hypothetical protein
MLNKLKGFLQGFQSLSMWEAQSMIPRKEPQPTDAKDVLTEVIQRAQSGGFSLQNDYARTNAQVVAMAASCGYITTEQKRGSFGRKWLATRKGKAYLEVN